MTLSLERRFDAHNILSCISTGNPLWLHTVVVDILTLKLVLYRNLVGRLFLLSGSIHTKLQTPTKTSKIIVGAALLYEHHNPNTFLDQ